MEVKERKGLKERRERILKAAKKVFAQKGFQAATVDEIAELAGVGKGTIYRRVGNKKQLLHALLHQAADSLAEKIVKDTQQQKDPAKKLKGVFNALTNWYEKNLDLSKLFFSSVHSHRGRAKKKKPKKHQHKEEHAIYKTVQDIIKEGKEKKVFSKTADPAIITEAIFHLLTPFFYEELRQRFGLNSSQIANAIFELFHKGLKA